MCTKLLNIIYTYKYPALSLEMHQWTKDSSITQSHPIYVKYIYTHNQSSDIHHNTLVHDMYITTISNNTLILIWYMVVHKLQANLFLSTNLYHTYLSIAHMFHLINECRIWLWSVIRNAVITFFCQIISPLIIYILHPSLPRSNIIQYKLYTTPVPQIFTT